MNIKSFALCTIVGFVFVFIYEYIVHGVLLVPAYEQTPELWRPMEEYESFMGFAITMQILTTAALALIYTRHHEGKGFKEGIRFGVMLGILLGLLQFSSFIWMPISIMLAGAWLVTSFLKTVGLGIIFSLLYENKK